MNDLVKRHELGINKIIYYSRQTRRLKMVDPLVVDETPARCITPQPPPSPAMLSAPLKIFFSLTRKCDLDCRMCFSKDRTYPQPQLTIQDIKNFIFSSADIGVLEIRLTGGEPTIHPDFFQIVDWIVDAGMNISINTHGVFSNHKMHLVAASQICDFHISLDGPEEIHDGLRGAGSFEKTVQTIHYLKNAGKQVRLNSMIFHRNTHLLKETIQIAEHLDTPIRLCPMRSIGRANSPTFPQHQLLTEEEWQDMKKKLASLAQKSRVAVIYFSNDEIADFRTCTGPPQVMLENAKCGPWLTQLGMDPEGDVYAGGCIDDIPKKLSLGSIKEMPIQELWARANRYVCERMLAKIPKCRACHRDNLWERWSKNLSRPSRSSHHF